MQHVRIFRKGTDKKSSNSIYCPFAEHIALIYSPLFSTQFIVPQPWRGWLQSSHPYLKRLMVFVQWCNKFIFKICWSWRTFAPASHLGWKATRFHHWRIQWIVSPTWCVLKLGRCRKISTYFGKPHAMPPNSFCDPSPYPCLPPSFPKLVKSSILYLFRV